MTVKYVMCYADRANLCGEGDPAAQPSSVDLSR